MLEYANEKNVKSYIKKWNVFIATQNKKIVGTITLDGNLLVSPYVSNSRNFVRDPIMINLLKFAEKRTKKLGYNSIKLISLSTTKDYFKKKGYSVNEKLILGREVKFEEYLMEKSPLEVKIKKGKSLIPSEIKTMANSRIKQYGNNRINFKEQKKSTFFFVKDNKKIVAFGMLKPITMDYNKKDYKILGIGNILSIKKGKGYGKIIMQEILNYLKKKGKTGLGFCGRKNMPFYEKCGFNTKKRLGLRFALKDIKTGEIRGEDPDDVGDGLYYEGKDKLISKMLKTKSIGYYWVPNLDEPHW
jgi:N-acetylglutamate synthase-like GNAT family acetyltransferase